MGEWKILQMKDIEGGNFPGGTEENNNTLSQNIVFPGQGLYFEPPTYEIGVLITILGHLAGL
jgi:hypothetical protein